MKRPCINNYSIRNETVKPDELDKIDTFLQHNEKITLKCNQQAFVFQQ